MVTRSLCLCDGKLIGIEYIYTIINGMQINDKERLEWMREKARSRQLFCPCGCGANLTVVAGDRNLREQHFRILEGNGSDECRYVEEGETSVNSKVILKCWLDEKLQDEDLEARVPISDISDSNRKFEFTFLSRKHGIAVNYCRHRADLSREKLGILEQNADGISIIHIVDEENEATNLQLPEGMMKIQEWQGYCLALHIDGREYEKAELKVLTYERDLDGFWMTVMAAKGKLSEFGFGVEGKLTINGVDVSEKVVAAREQFQRKQDFRREEREAYRRSIEEQRERERKEAIRRENERRIEAEKRRAEEERRRAEEQKRWDEIRRQAEQRKKEQAEEEERKRLDEEERLASKNRRMAEFWENINAEIDRNDKQSRDPDGKRWIKCKRCGFIGGESEFYTYGGPKSMNYGVCYKCSKEQKDKDKIIPVQKYNDPVAKDDNTCPRCGGKLKVRYGSNGGFIGCSNFPNCHFTKQIRN